MKIRHGLAMGVVFVWACGSEPEVEVAEPAPPPTATPSPAAEATPSPPPEPLYWIQGEVVLGRRTVQRSRTSTYRNERDLLNQRQLRTESTTSVSGADFTAGMEVNLVNAESLLTHLEIVVERSAYRNLGIEIAENSRTRRYMREAREGKEKELADFKKSKWAHFIYKDPITDQEIVGAWTNPGMVPMMEDRLTKMGESIVQYGQHGSRLLEAQKSVLARLREIDGKLAGLGDIEADAALFDGVRPAPTAEDIFAFCLSELFASEELELLETAILGSDGMFAFRDMTFGRYLCLAEHSEKQEATMTMIVDGKEHEVRSGNRSIVLKSADSDENEPQEEFKYYAWLQPVTWKQGKEPQKAILTGTNSIYEESWYTNRRLDRLLATLKERLEL